MGPYSSASSSISRRRSRRSTARCQSTGRSGASYGMAALSAGTATGSKACLKKRKNGTGSWAEHVDMMNAAGAASAFQKRQTGLPADWRNLLARTQHVGARRPCPLEKICRNGGGGVPATGTGRLTLPQGEGGTWYLIDMGEGGALVPPADMWLRSGGTAMTGRAWHCVRAPPCLPGKSRGHIGISDGAAYDTPDMIPAGTKKAANMHCGLPVARFGP